MMHATSAAPLVHPPIAGPVTAANVDLRHAIKFATGLPGFESCRSFVLLASDGSEALHYLTALEGPAASFLVVDPRHVQPGYRCELTEGDAQRLGVQDLQAPLLWLALVMLENNGTVSVNLRAPVVINPARMVGQQVIPYNTTYPLRHVLVQGE
jgi:flagellar assembly factor FliW